MLFSPLCFSEQQDCEIAQEIQEKLAIEAERRRIQEKKDEVQLSECPSTPQRRTAQLQSCDFLYSRAQCRVAGWATELSPFGVHSPRVALHEPLFIAL